MIIFPRGLTATKSGMARNLAKVGLHDPAVRPRTLPRVGRGSPGPGNPPEPDLAVLKAKTKIKNPRIRAGIGPTPTISLGKGF